MSGFPDIIAIIRPDGIAFVSVSGTGTEPEIWIFSVMPKLIMLRRSALVSAGPSMTCPIHAWSKDQPPLPSVGVAAPNTGP